MKSSNKSWCYRTVCVRKENISSNVLTGMNFYITFTQYINTAPCVRAGERLVVRPQSD
jgi:hypothetical protein